MKYFDDPNDCIVKTEDKEEYVVQHLIKSLHQDSSFF